MHDHPRPPGRPFSLGDVGGIPGKKPARAIGVPGVHPTPPAVRSAALTTAQRLREAHGHVRAGRFTEADELLRPLIKAKKPDAGALQLMAVICEKQRRPSEAFEYARRAEKIRPNDLSKMVIARACRVMGRTDECLRWIEKILKNRPAEPQCLAIKAGALEEAGRVDEAASVLAPLLEAAGGDEAKLPVPIREVWARVLVQRKDYARAIEVIDSALGEIPVEEPKVNLLHLKAKACDRSGDYDGAWAAAERANEIGRLDYDPDLHTKQVDALIEIWSEQNTRDFPVTKCDSLVPVFVAGMPRSGTSLIDQIIDAHPKAAGVGELSAIEKFALALSANYDPQAPPEGRFGPMGARRWQRTADAYVKHILSVSPRGVERVVNKALGNNKLVGLIARLFPKTRIIHAIRDPRDVAISCFMGGFNNKMHPWTSRVDWTAHVWGLSQRMMDHWKATLDVPILDVHYERLVSHPETEFPRLIEFLGLDFDPSCYDFYKSKRVVRTLSYDQVNRPLYTTSAGRHRNYLKYIRDIDFPAYNPGV